MTKQPKKNTADAAVAMKLGGKPREPLPIVRTVDRKAKKFVSKQSLEAWRAEDDGR